MKHSTLRMALGAVFLGVALAACGGGGGTAAGGTTPPAPPPTPGLTLLAGTVTPGHAVVDGIADHARFGGIRALAADSAGTIYVSDSGGSGPVLRKVGADGAVSTVAADWSQLPSTPEVRQITSVSVAGDGSIYFSYAGFVNPGGAVITATTGFYKLGTDGKFTNLGSSGNAVSDWKVLAAPDGTLYVYSTFGIYVLGGDGSLQLLAGATDGGNGDVDGVGASARFRGILRILSGPNGNLYVLDAQGLRQVNKTGVTATLVKQDNLAIDLSLDKQGNPLLLAPYTVPSYSYQINTFRAGAISPLYTLGSASGSDQLAPTALLGMPDGSVVVSDDLSLTRISSDGKATVFAGVRDDSGDRAADGQGGQARLIAPALLAADQDGNIYSAENGGVSNPLIIRKITPSGNVSTLIASSTLGPGAIISGMAVTPANTLVISTATQLGFGGQLYTVTPDGALVRLAGSDFYNIDMQQKDGQGNAAVFRKPSLIGADKDGNLYAYDVVETATGQTSIRKITPQGIVSTIPSLPAGLGAAWDGNVYKINAGGAGVLRVAADGTQTLVAGSDTSSYMIVPSSVPTQLYLARSIVPLGDHVFALAAGNGIYRLVLP